MSPDIGQVSPPDENEEKQLCLGCLFPNDPEAHFCTACGAPLTSYAATGPFEHLFAEGYLFRQAAERPRKRIVVLGVWLIFGSMALMGLFAVSMGLNVGIENSIVGAFILAISVVLICKTTWNYLARGGSAEDNDG